MKNVQAGDTVECVSNTDGLTKDRLYRVEKVEDESVWVLNDHGTMYGYYPQRFRLVSKGGGTRRSAIMSDNVNTKDRWSFHVSAVPMVDFDRISRNLDYGNPLAFVTIKATKGNDTEYYAVLHYSLIEKAEAAKGKTLKVDVDNALISCSMTVDSALVVKLRKPNEMKKFQKLVKRIKRAPFKKSLRFHAEVEVVIPSVD